MHDPDGDYFKAQEKTWRTTLRPEEWAVIRVDGRAFHTFTRGLPKPFSTELMATMDHTAEVLAMEIQGAVCAYVQSDEISVIIAPPPEGSGTAWFGGQVQKVCSVAASAATGAFNSHWAATMGWGRWAMFDARVFTLPMVDDVGAYLDWRQRDCTRNAISMLSEFYIGKGNLKGVKTRERIELLSHKGVVLPEQNQRFVLGGLTYPTTSEELVTYIRKDTQEEESAMAMRRRWDTYNVERIGDWFESLMDWTDAVIDEV